MNDLSAMCGSGRLGTSCHSFASLHEDGNTVTWELGAKMAITRYRLGWVPLANIPPLADHIGGLMDAPCGAPRERSYVID